MKRLGLVLLSGGLDSATAASVACRAGYEMSALTIDYGQVHHREIEGARRVAATLGLKHCTVHVPFYGELACYSALTHPDEFGIPVGSPLENIGTRIPITYVPMRNTLFLVLGAAYLESEVLRAIEIDGVNPTELEAALFIGANAIDYSGYPDCRPEYFAAVTDALRRGSKISTQYGVQFRVETPLLDKSKADIIRLANELEAAIEYTWSCYRGEDRPCGQCDSCALRAKGFKEAGLPDPALAVT